MFVGRPSNAVSGAASYAVDLLACNKNMMVILILTLALTVTLAG